MLGTTRDCSADAIRPHIEAYATDRAGRIRKHARPLSTGLSRASSLRVLRESTPGSTVTAMLTSLRDLVGHVRRLCPEEEVIRPDTLPHVTAMQHVQPRRNRAAIQNPRQAVRGNVCGSVYSVGLAQTTVASRVARSEPQPARARASDFAPETFIEGFDRPPAWNNSAAFRACVLYSHTSALATHVALAYSAIGAR